MSVAWVAQRYAMSAGLIFKWLHDPCHVLEPTLEPDAARLPTVGIVIASCMTVLRPPQTSSLFKISVLSLISPRCAFRHPHLVTVQADIEIAPIHKGRRLSEFLT